MILQCKEQRNNMYTNKHGLPDAIFNAVTNDPYSNEGSDITVTRLINPPQMERLKRLHEGEIVEDAMDRLWAMMGQAAHVVLERAAGHHEFTEERFHSTVLGFKVSGQADSLTLEGILRDYKLTSVWAIKSMLEGGKTEWEQQLNLLAALARRNGMTVNKMFILAIARDWRNSESFKMADYPPRAVEWESPRWDDTTADIFLEHRVRLHLVEEIVPKCTPEEQWRRDTKWAVVKKPGGKALRLLPSEYDAHEWKLQNIGNDGLVEKRPGSATRCEQYCVVKDFCPQYKEENNDRD